MGLTDYVVLAAIVLLILWVIFAAIKKWWPSAATTTAGTTLGKVVDTTQAISAYMSLTAIRQLDSVEADPAAIAACDLLRNVVTSWRRPEA